MQDSDIDRKRFKAIGHSLKPVIIVSHKGLSANIRNEIDRALSDHELIKIKILTAKRADRDDISKEICRHRFPALVAFHDERIAMVHSSIALIPRLGLRVRQLVLVLLHAILVKIAPLLYLNCFSDHGS